MDYLIFLLLLVALGIEIYILKKDKKVVEYKIVEKPVKLKKEDKEKQEKLRKNFQNMMDYDYEVALKSKEEE